MVTLSARKSEVKKALDVYYKAMELNNYKLSEADKKVYFDLKDKLTAIEEQEKLLARTKAEKNTEFIAIYYEAYAAGMKAGQEAIPTPMVVSGGVPGEVEKNYYISEGMCGFAWVTIRPSYGKFASWLKAMGYGSYSAYDRAVLIWCHEFNQSVTRKEAFAEAFADVLTKHDIPCSSHSRLD